MNESGKNIYSENPEQQSTLGTVAYLSASGAETLVLESILEVFLPCVVETSSAVEQEGPGAGGQGGGKGPPYFDR